MRHLVLMGLHEERLQRALGARDAVVDRHVPPRPPAPRVPQPHRVLAVRAAPRGARRALGAARGSIRVAYRGSNRVRERLPRIVACPIRCAVCRNLAILTDRFGGCALTSVDKHANVRLTKTHEHALRPARARADTYNGRPVLFGEKAAADASREFSDACECGNKPAIAKGSLARHFQHEL